MEDQQALAIRSLDEPLDPQDRETLRVWADALESAGDPRGALISLEHVLREHPERARAVRRGMIEHVAANAGHLLGGFAPHVAFPRAVVLDWRSGMLDGAFLDTRYLARTTGLRPAELVAELLEAPIAATLRRLHVRVRSERHHAPVFAAVQLCSHPPPLEEVLVLPGVRPLAIAPGHQRSPYASALTAAYPDLRLLAHGTRVFGLPLAQHPLLITQLPPILGSLVPSTRAGRLVLGRALVHPDPAVRAAALDRLSALGRQAFMFVDALMMLLGPGLCAPQAPIVACLAAVGEDARVALPLLATITGRAAHYDRDTRSAAGAAIAALRR
ncbi:MAG TPA: hypothetical protein VGD80_33330 [Kofleriaceae bacterium]